MDSSGYARLKHWRIYGEEGLARREVALWLGPDVLNIEFAGETLARYEVKYSPRTDRLREVKRPRLFETAHRRGAARQPRLFELADLGEGGWLKALKLGEYAPRGSRRPQALQGECCSPTVRRMDYPDRAGARCPRKSDSMRLKKAGLSWFALCPASGITS